MPITITYDNRLISDELVRDFEDLFVYEFQHIASGVPDKPIKYFSDKEIREILRIAFFFASGEHEITGTEDGVKLLFASVLCLHIVLFAEEDSFRNYSFFKDGNSTLRSDLEKLLADYKETLEMDMGKDYFKQMFDSALICLFS